MDLFTKIQKLGKAQAIDFIGVAGLMKHQLEIAAVGGSVAAGFPRAISIGIILPHSIVELLRDREIYENVFQYKIHAYDVINDRLDIFASMVSSVIQQGGYRAMPVPAAERIDSERVCASISHKITARLAGLGWIGKNCLLINPDHGPRVRWTTVLTDVPLQENHHVLENRCGGCNECVKACPARAILGKNYVDGEVRELRLDVPKCEAYFRELERANRLKICGMCLYACPYGKRSKGQKTEEFI